MRRAGQALVEFALLLPVMGLVLLGTVDVGRAYHYSVEILAAARAGDRIAVNSDSTDVGTAIRTEPSPEIPDSSWGNMASGQPHSCGPTSTSCGDPAGCPVPSPGGSAACFSIRPCTLSSNSDLGGCSSYGTWGTRPARGSTTKGIQVRVVFRMDAYTPFLSQMTRLTGNSLYLQSQQVGDVLY